MTTSYFADGTPIPDENTGPSPITAIEARRKQLADALLNDAGLARIPAPAPLVDGLLYLDSLAWLHGKPGHGKSFVGVDLACSIGTGQPWHGRSVTQGGVLYVIAEGASGLGQRVESWKLANGAFDSGVRFLPIAVQLLQQTDMQAFLQVLADQRPSLVVIDTQARATVGAEENSAKDMGELVNALEQIRGATGACVLVVHHESRAGEALRGSTALEGAATSILRCVKDGAQLTISNTKQKDAPEQPDQILALAPIGDSAVVSHEAVGVVSIMTDSEHKILSALREQFGSEGAATTRLLKASGIPDSSYYRALNALKTKGLVTEQKIGVRKILLPASLDGQQEVS